LAGMKDRAPARVDHLGRAYAGSQLQIQIYVNRRSGELSRRIVEALPSLAPLSPRLRWVSPLECQKFSELQDREFLRALGLGHLDGQLRRFWPRGGPVWDALAAVDIESDPARRGVVLVEAKSYPAEIYGAGCQASPRSRKKIEAALRKTKSWLGVPEDIDWTGPLYQSANRLAHLYFFREEVGMPAWLVNAYFVNDPDSPTIREEWWAALDQVKRELGLTGIAIPDAAELFLEAKHRRELVGERSAVGRYIALAGLAAVALVALAAGAWYARRQRGR
jgi:hypothetical protein